MPVLWLLANLFLAGCHRAEPVAAAAPPASKVEDARITFAPNAPQLASLAVQPAAPRRLAVAHLTGRLFWDDETTVRVFTPVMGQVSAIRVEVGQKVAAGAPLAEIISPDFGQARADARTAEANLAAAEKAFSRTTELEAHGAAARKDVEAAEATRLAARAERDRAVARLQLYHGDENSAAAAFVLCAPLAGVVVEKNINPGQEVRNDQMLAGAGNLFAPLFVISEPRKLWLQLDAAETDLAALHTGQALRVSSRAMPDRVFSGTIENIGLALDPQSRTVRIRGAVENPDLLLKAEMYVSVDVVQDEAKVAAAGVDVPAKAVFMMDNRYYLFVELAPGQFERREVPVGTEKDGTIPVLAGVAAGQNVVAEGALLLESVLVPN